MSGSTIVLEFNELVPRLMDQFIAEGVLPNFSQLRRESLILTTNAEEKAPALEPWIQWVTIHTGKSYDQHKVFELTDGPLYKGDRIWDIVSDTGSDVWVCGSMNSAVRNGKVKGFVVPDPWAVGIAPQPPGLFDDYFRFVSTYVKEYSAATVPLSAGDHIRFGLFLLKHGLSARTIWAAVKQLATERQRDRKWARAFILDLIQFDVFWHFYSKARPKFSTLFLNSTAHFQHFYWRNMEPDAFEIKPSAEDQARYQDAIRSGYIQMDRLVGILLKRIEPDTTIVFATALSQQPLVKYDQDGGKQLFKPFDNDRLMRLAGITAPCRVDQAMSEQYYLVFDTEEQAIEATERLAKLTTSKGDPLLFPRRTGSKISVVCSINKFQSDGVLCTSPYSNETPSFNKLFYPIHGVKSGGHHPDGMLWVRRPDRRSATIERKVSLQEVAPTLLALCGVEPAEGAFAFPPIPEVMGASDTKHKASATLQAAE